jgi:hypothetical protein
MAAISSALCMLRSVPLGSTGVVPVCVLVGAALPWAVKIAEVELRARVDLQACVQGPTDRCNTAKRGIFETAQ